MSDNRCNRLTIRRRDGEVETPVDFGGRLEVLLNGEPLRCWQRVTLDLSRDEFVVAELTIAVGELVVDANAALILEAAAARVVVEGKPD